MRLSVKVRPGAKEDRVEKISESEYILRVKAQAKEGRANDAVRQLLGEYFKVPKSRIEVARGHASRIKVIDVWI